MRGRATMMDGIARGRRGTYNCPVEFAIDIIRGKWKATVLSKLKEEPLAYGELRRLMPDLSDKVLTERLRDLEADGLIERKKGKDGRVRYTVTSRAATLRPTLQALFEWGTTMAADMGVEIRPAMNPPA